MTYFHVRYLTWDAEKVQHCQPYADPIAPGAPMLCGTRLPDYLGPPIVDETTITKPVCRRCSRAFWKIWRRKRSDFEADALREISDLAPTGR